MKQYLNKNFNLCISTWIFMLFDLYVVSYKNEKNESYINDLFSGLKNNTLHLDNFLKENTYSIYSKVITDISDAISINDYNLSHKLINKININTANVYKWIEPNDSKMVIAFQIKKFDNLNYIMPIMVTFSEQYLDNSERNLNLDQFYEFLNNRKEILEMLNKFNIL